ASSPHPATVAIVVAQPRLMKLPHRLVQIPRQLRYGLRAHAFSREGATTRPTCRVLMPAKTLPGSTARLLRPAAEIAATPPAESSSGGCAQCGAEWAPSGARNPARSSRCDRCAAAHAVVRSAPLRKTGRAPVPTAARKTVA